MLSSFGYYKRLIPIQEENCFPAKEKQKDHKIYYSLPLQYTDFLCWLDWVSNSPPGLQSHNDSENYCILHLHTTLLSTLQSVLMTISSFPPGISVRIEANQYRPANLVHIIGPSRIALFLSQCVQSGYENVGKLLKRVFCSL